MSNKFPKIKNLAAIENKLARKQAQRVRMSERKTNREAKEFFVLSYVTHTDREGK